jgi:hypothetical protein
MIYNSTRAIAASMAVVIFAGASHAETINIRSNTVVPVILENDLSFKNSRQGDRFYARVDDGRDLPYGTRLEGRILRIEDKRGDRPAYMDVEFTTLLLPGEKDLNIRAVPISLDSKYVERDRDGRFTAKQGAIRKDQYVWGGIIGGALLGSIIGRKTFEGAFVGAIAGIIAAESAGKQEQMVLKSGTRMGALFEKDVRVNFNGTWNGRSGDRYDDRYGQDRDGRYDPRYDDRKDPRYDDRNRPGSDSYDSRYPQDRYGYDDLHIEYRNRELRFSRAEQPYRMGSTIMVPLERTAAQMGIDYEYSGKTILLEDDDDILKLEQDSDGYRLNGKRGTLSRNIIKRDGVVYVPLEILAAMKKESVHVNGDKVRF